MPITPPPYAKAKASKFLSGELAEYINKHSLANRLSFIVSKDSNEKLYKTYFAPNAPKKVDVGDKIGDLAKLASAKKWSAMSAFIKNMRETTTKSTNMVLDQYYESLYGQNVLAVWKMGLDGSKAKSALPLVSLYNSSAAEDQRGAAFKKVA